MKLPAELATLADVYRSWHYWLITIFAVVVYYEIFRYLIFISGRGVIILAVPSYLVYVLDTSASVLLTLGFFYFGQALQKKRKLLATTSSGALSSLSMVVAGISVGCACQAPILYNLLYFLGLNSLEASGIVVGIDDYQVQIMWLLVLLNISLIAITTRRIAKTSPQATKNSKKTPKSFTN
jgi:hypothetical protein